MSGWSKVQKLVCMGSGAGGGAWESITKSRGSARALALDNPVALT